MDLTINMVFQNFTLTKSDSLEFTITLKDTEIAPDDIIFKVKDNVNSSVTVISKSLSDEEIERTDDEGFVYKIYIPSTDTDDLKILNYIYQIELVFGSVHDTVAEGKFIITPEL